MKNQRDIHIIFHDQLRRNCPAQRHIGADSQVYITGQYTEQHTRRKDDNIAVLHDQVVHVHRCGIDAPCHYIKYDKDDEHCKNHAIVL